MVQFSSDVSAAARSRNPDKPNLLAALERGRCIRTRDLGKIGASRTALYRLVKQGIAVKDGSGFRLATTPPLNSFEQIAIRWPKTAVICLVSAQHVHGLTEDMEVNVTVALPPNAVNRSRSPNIPGIRVVTWGASDFYTLGVERIEAGNGRTIGCTDLYRTAADMWRPEHRVSVEQAQKALSQIAVLHGREGLRKVLRHATRLGFGRFLQSRVEAMSDLVEAPRVESPGY